MKVFIDPGHGGEDSGAIGPTGYYEKEFNMQTAKLLELGCKWRGWDTAMSRAFDYNVNETDSAHRANFWGADVFVSIHANGAVSTANGCEVLYWNTSTRSAALALKVQHLILDAFPWLRDRGIKPRFPGSRGSAVLRKTEMPAILVEPMFITNPSEESVLRVFATKALIADAILTSLDLTIGS